MKRLLIVLCVLVLASGVIGQNLVDLAFSHPLTWTGHYIKWVKWTPVIADSFTYRDTIITEAADTVAITWTSHPQKLKITPTAANNYEYCDSLMSGVNKHAMTYTSGGSGTTVATVCAGFVAAWNLDSDVKDTVRAEDSTTYIILRDIRTGAARPAVRWTTACPSRLADTTSAGRLTTVEMACDSLVAKINANVKLAPVLTAYDSTTLYHVRSDDSDLVYEVIDVANDSQAVAIISPAGIDYTDTTWYHIPVPGFLTAYANLWIALEYDATLGGMATKDTLWADLQRAVSFDTSKYSTVKACVLSHDSLFGTTTWNLEAYYRAATAGDSLLRYPYLWLRVIDRQHLLDSGASLGVYQDSTWRQILHVLVRGQR